MNEQPPTQIGTRWKKWVYRSPFQFFGLIVGVLLASTLSSGLGALSEQGEQSTSGVLAAIPDEELVSLEGIARATGLSLEQATLRYGWNDEFSQLSTELAERFPSEYAGSRIDDSSNAYIEFKGSVPIEAVPLLRAFDTQFIAVDIDLRENVGYSASEIEELVARSHLDVFEQVDVDVTTFHDDRTGAIVFEIATPDQVAQVFDILELELVAQRAVDEATPETLAVDFDAVVTRSPLSDLGGVESSSFHYGGEIISMCTSGFGSRSTSHTSGTRGVLTAAHCGNSQSDDGSALSYQSGHEGVNGDVQWHTGPKTESDKFYQGSASSTEVNLISVSSVANPAGGAAVCRNGKTTDQHCDTVLNSHICQSGICGLVRTYDWTSGGGDSGGPYFWGSKAYGIHRGKMHDGAYPYETRGVFTRALNVDDAIGVYIATN